MTLAPCTLAFADIETITLEPGGPRDSRVWEAALIRRDTDGVDTEYVWQFEVDAGKADIRSLNVGHWFHRRWPTLDRSLMIDAPGVYTAKRDRAVDGLADDLGKDDYDGVVVPADAMDEWADWFTRLVWGGHLIGAVPNFDDRRLDALLRDHHACPSWHYHLGDIENIAVGYLAARRLSQAGGGEDPLAGLVNPPWSSEDLSRAVGVNPDEYERHTALGDVRWARDWWDAMIPAPPGPF